MADTHHETQDKKFNVTVNPLLLILGGISAEGQIAVTDKITVGPKASYFSLDIGEVDISVYSIGAVSQYSLNGAYADGTYIKTQAAYTGINGKDTSKSGSSCKGDVGMFNIGATGGYQWFWGNGINTNIGAGYNVNIGDSTLEYNCDDGIKRTEDIDTTGTSGLALEWSLGYAF